MDSKHLCKITAGEDELYLLSTEVMDEENRFGQFSLSLCDGSNIWSGLGMIRKIFACVCMFYV